MNLYFRLIKVVIVALLGRPIQSLGESSITLRVWPNDLDANLHMNNGRYLTLMDLGRFDLLIRTGLLRTIFRRRWMPVLAAATIRFRRSLDPFQRFRLRTRVLGWNSKSVIMEQIFESLDGHVAARSLVRAVFRRNGGTVPTEELVGAAGLSGDSPHLREYAAAWLAAEERLSERHTDRAA